MSLGTAEILIESTRISIKPFSANDAAAVFPCITRSLTCFMSWGPPANRNDFDRVWQFWLPKIADGSDFVFVIGVRLGNGNFCTLRLFFVLLNFGWSLAAKLT